MPARDTCESLDEQTEPGVLASRSDDAEQSAADLLQEVATLQVLAPLQGSANHMICVNSGPSASALI
jgi:hypothetical protein